MRWVVALVLVTAFVMAVRVARVNHLVSVATGKIPRHAGASAAQPRIGPAESQETDPPRPDRDNRGGAELAPA